MTLRALPFVFLSISAFAASGVDGNWNLRLLRFGDVFAAARVELKTNGSKVTGTLNELKFEGTFENGLLRITGTRPNGESWGKMEGRLEGDEMSGTVTRDKDEFAWKAVRAPNITEGPQTRVFEPVKFHRQFSGVIEPALRINPGDTIRTTTVDAGGTDASGVRRSMGGNPETGPFYVEGAMPGDTLVVKFNRIRLNRDSAISGDRIVSHAVTPDYYRDAKFDEKFNSDWALDRAAGYAKLAKPTEKLKNFRVKLQPMLGCVSVAPSGRQALRSGWLGSFGGNMDFNGLREGVTVYLPVYQEGAILFVGDGHAAQGDGELNGDALETSMDVEFTVNLVRGKSSEGPRMENDEYLMASGISNSLPEAIQMATTELARWLERDYGLNANESNVVLGTSIHYDVAELVDPQVHIVARISKAVLATIGH